MANQPTSFRYPFTLPVHQNPEIEGALRPYKDALRLTYQGVKDVNDAIRAEDTKVVTNTTNIVSVQQSIQAVMQSVATVSAAVAANLGLITNLSGFHDEPLTDGQGNFIFAGGDCIVVIDIPN
jgi:hypothetical protein